jgi:DNA-binding transcriptional ArsR family regulator
VYYYHFFDILANVSEPLSSDVIRPPKLFGSPNRTRILLAIALLGDSYVLQLAELLKLQQSMVFRIVNDFEQDGIVTSRYVGRTRTISLNLRRYGMTDLENFLLKFSKGTDVEERVAGVRRRPRRRGKAL